MSDLLYQSDRRWGRHALGLAAATYGKSGCVALSVINAARELGSRPSLTPLDANSPLVAVGAFPPESPTKLNVEKAAELFGLSAPYSARKTAAAGDDLAAAITTALKDDSCALLRVAYVGRHDPNHDGHHTILARGWTSPGRQQVECWCPAVGRVLIALPALTGTAEWSQSDTRTYKVVKVHPIRVPPT